MGWGPFQLMTDDPRDPKEMLAMFGEGFGNAVINHEYTPQLHDTHAYGYDCETDCGVILYCSECGKAMCAGCGDRPFLIITEEKSAAYCQRKKCRAARDKLLREFWPTVPFASQPNRNPPLK